MLLNKLDRLILELKLPPQDAYYKLKHTLDEVNVVIQKYAHLSQKKVQLASPLSGNVLFGSTLFGCAFSIQSFAKRYSQNQSLLRQQKHHIKGEQLQSHSQ